MGDDVEEAGGHEDAAGEAGKQGQPLGALPVGPLALLCQTFCYLKPRLLFYPPG